MSYKWSNIWQAWTFPRVFPQTPGQSGHPAKTTPAPRRAESGRRGIRMIGELQEGFLSQLLCKTEKATKPEKKLTLWKILSFPFLHIKEECLKTSKDYNSTKHDSCVEDDAYRWTAAVLLDRLRCLIQQVGDVRDDRTIWVHVSRWHIQLPRNPKWCHFLSMLQKSSYFYNQTALCLTTWLHNSYVKHGIIYHK